MNDILGPAVDIPEYLAALQLLKELNDYPDTQEVQHGH